MTKLFPCSRHPSTPLRMTILAALANLLLRQSRNICLAREICQNRLTGQAIVMETTFDVKEQMNVGDLVIIPYQMPRMSLAASEHISLGFQGGSQTSLISTSLTPSSSATAR